MRRATPARSRTGRAMPRAIMTLAMIDTMNASSDISASRCCSRRNGSSASDIGSCRTATTDSSPRVGRCSTRVIASSLSTALPCASLLPNRSSAMPCMRAARAAGANVLACRRQPSLPCLLRNETCSRVRFRKSFASASLTEKPIASHATGSGASTGTTTI